MKLRRVKTEMPRDLAGRLIHTDVFGRKIPRRQLKREVLSENRERGRVAEENYRTRMELSGYEVERTGKGHDFRVRKRNPFTGKVEYTGLREIKSSRTAPISKLQKKTMKKKANYKVIRERPWF